MLFAVALLTGDEIEKVHIWAGYEIAALVALRIIWGFVGPRIAQFSGFVKGPREVGDFILRSTRRKAPRSIGHNPVGGLMIVALLAMLVGLSVTGYMMTTDAYWGSGAIEDIHEALAYTTPGLVGLHVLSVLITSVEHGENLVKAMVTGRKKAP